MSIAPVSGFNTAKWIVSATAGQGTHTTIATALTAASSGDTIFIRPGTYTENLTLKAGVNLTAFGSDSSLNGTGNVIISGTCTLSVVGSVTISGIQLQTNNAALLVVSGTVNSIVNLNSCYLNCTNATGITYSSSGASSAVNINNCWGDIGTTGISLWTITASGIFTVEASFFTNSGSSTTASSTSTVGHGIRNSYIAFALSTSSSGNYTIANCAHNCAAINTACLTTAGTGTSSYNNCNLQSGSASAISVGSGSQCNFVTGSINSSNTNCITGAGTIKYGTIDFGGSSQTINTTTQGELNAGTFTPGVAFGGSSTGITYSTQSGTYTRIGNIVFVNIAVVLTSKGAQTGTMTFTGLPFTAGSTSQRAFAEVANVTFVGSYVGAIFVGGTTTGQLDYITSAAGTTLITNTGFANNSTFTITGFYFC